MRTLRTIILAALICLLLIVVAFHVSILKMQDSFSSAPPASLEVFSSPSELFQGKFGFELPLSAEIMNYDYYADQASGEECLYMKIIFDENDYEIINNGIHYYYLEQFGGFNRISEFSIFPDFKRVCTWWDMGVDEIVMDYVGVTRGKVVFTVFIYAFITKDEEEQCFLYIAY